jgi:methylphosphotriester-DNA--protein-cysteine methyltransferase
MSDPNENYNQFGHTPCPRCESHFRFMHCDHGNSVVCEACGLLEPATRKNSSEYSAADLGDEDDRPTLPQEA